MIPESRVAESLETYVRVSPVHGRNAQGPGLLDAHPRFDLGLLTFSRPALCRRRRVGVARGYKVPHSTGGIGS